MSNAKTVNEYIGRFPDWRGAAVAKIRRIIRNTEPKLTESIKWAHPVFEQNGPVCYITVFAKQVNFGFWRGAMLDDPRKRLRGDGARMRNVRITSMADIDAAQFAKWVSQAARLNLKSGKPFARRLRYGSSRALIGHRQRDNWA